MEGKREREDAIDESKRKILKINHYSSQEEISQSSSKEDPSEKDGEEEGDAESNPSSNFSSIVAAHYNSVQGGFDKRNNSRIYYLRNFNNWVKSLLIINIRATVTKDTCAQKNSSVVGNNEIQNEIVKLLMSAEETVWKVQDYNQRKLKVLDMCCGKGGDLFKWAKLNIRYMVCTDIAQVTLDEYKVRYTEYKDKCQKNEKPCQLECEFIPADCTRVRLRGKYHDPSIQFDVVSCQFSFHYCFESLPQAECMLKNASECLKLGGLFIGTIPNSNEIVKRLKKSESNSFRNEVFSLEMCCQEPYPLFGSKYNFYLDDVVNCPEFLVHFPTFVKLAAKFGFELVKKETFPEFFERGSKTREGEILMKKIKALEIYPPPGERKLVGPVKDYMHAKVFCEQNNVRQVGTLSKSEWDIVSLYQTFVFKKVAAK